MALLSLGLKAKSKDAWPGRPYLLGVACVEALASFSSAACTHSDAAAPSDSARNAAACLARLQCTMDSGKESAGHTHGHAKHHKAEVIAHKKSKNVNLCAARARDMRARMQRMAWRRREHTPSCFNTCGGTLNACDN